MELELDIPEIELKYVTDGKRHLICVPYSIPNLHLMATRLGIKRCWFHKNHYDIPEKRIEEIEKQCVKVSQKNIVEIIRSPQYAEIIISDIPTYGGGNGNSHAFEATQIQIKGQNLNYE